MNYNQSLPLNILVTGTPGVGKTTFGRLLEFKLQEKGFLGISYINLSEMIIGRRKIWEKDKKLYETWNQKYKVPEFDEDKVCDELEEIMNKGGVILDFHSSGFIPERWIDLVILLRTNNTILFDRLKDRG